MIDVHSSLLRVCSDGFYFLSEVGSNVSEKSEDKDLKAESWGKAKL